MTLCFARTAALAIVVGISLAGASPTVSAQEGRIVLANDEWTLSDTGFSNAPDTGTYVANVCEWFVGGAAGNFLAYSNNFGLTESQLATAITSLGHSWTVSTTVTFDLPTLQTYDAVFLCGFAADQGVLEDYVDAGGNVYVAAGSSGAGGDAQLWNSFLDAFGLGIRLTTNSRIGVLPVDLNHPLFHGVSGLYQNNGNDVIDRDTAECRAQLLWSEGGNDLYAAFDGHLGLSYDVYSPTYTAGDTIELTSSLGLPGGPVYLAVVDVDGVTFFLNILKDRFPSNCRWELETNIPSGLAGHSVTLLTYGFDVDGQLSVSNPQTMFFQ